MKNVSMSLRRGHASSAYLGGLYNTQMKSNFQIKIEIFKLLPIIKLVHGRLCKQYKKKSYSKLSLSLISEHVHLD